MSMICYVAYTAYFQRRAEKFLAENGISIDILVYSEEIVGELEARGYLALIARGGTAEELRRRVSVPVIEIPISFLDITQALLRASRYGKRIGVVGYGNFLNHLDALNPILDGEIIQIIARTPEETRRQIALLRDQKIDAVIGGYLQTETADELGVPGILLDLSESSLLEACQQAQAVVESTLLNARKSRELEMILDTTREAFVAIDPQLKITVANSTACRLCAAQSHEVIGQPLLQMFPSLKQLAEVLRSGRESLRDTLRIGKADVLCDMFPLQMQDGKIVGAIAAFNDINSITQNEHYIRNKLYGKGLCAAYTFQDIIHTSPIMKDLIQVAKRYAASDAAVLITGETGVGKELFAQSIHNAGSRRKGPFVAINCASIPESILESELFGYEEGAFTGAKRSGKPGYFELAHNGTIFLDEIGEMPVRLQARLLRVLQEKCVMRLGGNQVIPINVRIIAATNQDLCAMIEQGNFREDLFYRINVLALEVPPLRERPADIPALIEVYLRRHGSALRLTSEAEALLVQADWPGNVRQLYNFLERLEVVMERREVKPEDIRKILSPQLRAGEGEVPKAAVRRTPTRERLAEALAEAGGSRQAAAEILGIHRSTLWRLLKKYGLE